MQLFKCIFFFYKACDSIHCQSLVKPPLMPGEMAHVVKTTDGCCDKYEVVCKPETCAVQPPTCSPPQVMRNSNPGACCPTFKCGKWLNRGILTPFSEGWNTVELRYLSNIDILNAMFHKYVMYWEFSSTVYSLKMLSSMYW